MASTASVDLTPPFVEFTVLADEPHTILFPVQHAGSAVDLAADYPELTSRIKIGDEATVETVVEIQDTNVAVVVFPALQRGSKIYWELRDEAADQTWVTGRINVAKDALPQ